MMSDQPVEPLSDRHIGVLDPAMMPFLFNKYQSQQSSPPQSDEYSKHLAGAMGLGRSENVWNRSPFPSPHPSPMMRHCSTTTSPLPEGLELDYEETPGPNTSHQCHAGTSPSSGAFSTPKQSRALPLGLPLPLPTHVGPRSPLGTDTPPPQPMDDGMSTPRRNHQTPAEGTPRRHAGGESPMSTGFSTPLKQTPLPRQRNASPSPMPTTPTRTGSLSSYSPSTRGNSMTPGGARRGITTPMRILEAPSLIDEWDASALCWGPRNLLLIALDQEAYLWDHTVGAPHNLDSFDCKITAVAAAANSFYTALGLDDGNVLVYAIDPASTRADKQRAVRFNQRITCLAIHEHLLAIGCRDGSLSIVDVRSGVEMARHVRGAYPVSLVWSPGGSHLAIGTAKSVLVLHTTRLTEAAQRIARSTVPVRAIAWCPHGTTSVIAYAGGQNNSTIHVVALAEPETDIFEEDTITEVCAMQWAVHANELVVAYGVCTNLRDLNRSNAICFFDVGGPPPRLRQRNVVRGHQHRPLHLALSPDGAVLVSGAGGLHVDETLRFWGMFGSKRSPSAHHFGRASCGSGIGATPPPTTQTAFSSPGTDPLYDDISMTLEHKESFR